MTNLLLLLIVLGAVSASMGVRGAVAHTERPLTRTEMCEKSAVPSSFLLGDQLLHRMQVQRCLKRKEGP